MENKIWKIINLIRGFGGGPDEVVDSMYRTLKLKELGYKGSEPEDVLYNEMLVNVQGLKVYHGNSRIFYETFNLLNQLTLEGYFVMLDKINESLGRGANYSVIPDEISNVMFADITDDVKTVYVPDWEKFSYSLYKTIDKHPNVKFYTSSYSFEMQELMKLLFKDKNIELINHEYYKEDFVFKKFDRIISFPAIGVSGLEGEGNFISRDSALIAAQNLLYHLNSNGKLNIILPAKVTFGGADSVLFREYINQHYKINSISSLPNRTFYPQMSINTYLFNFSNGITEDILIRKYSLDKKLHLKDKNEKLMFYEEFEELNDWFIDVVFSDDFDEIVEYRESNVKKERLRDVSNVFRGRAVSRKVDEGNVSVINISDITEHGINFKTLDTIQEDQSKISRYILEEGDVLITSRGTNVKVAVFNGPSDIICIPSSNINVIRTNSKILIGSYLKLFLESEIGIKLLQSIQRGARVVNINYQDIKMLEVPIPSLESQKEIVSKYEEALKNYLDVVNKAERKWNEIKDEIHESLY